MESSGKNGDELGDRMKSYENIESERRLSPDKPFIARLDGKTFSKFTRGLAKPYDSRLSELMWATTKHLIKTTGATVGYTQSDEITLLYNTMEGIGKAERYYDGRIQKLTSVLAGMATAYFVRHLDTAITEKSGTMPLFDCRVWSVPNVKEVANTVIWRVF